MIRNPSKSSVFKKGVRSISQLSRRNIKETDRMHLIGEIRERLEREPEKNQKSGKPLLNQEIKIILNVSCVRKSGQTETDSEKRKRWNENCVNSKLAKLANVSPDKLFRYEVIKRECILEDIAGVEI